MSIIRWLPRLVIPLLIAMALVVDARIDRDPPATADGGPEALTQVMVPPPDALTSSWFCPVVGLRAPVPEFGETTTELLLTNMTDATASVSVELRGRTTGRQFVTAEVAPRSTGVVNTSDYARDEVIGALVEASSGGLAVTRRFVSPHGVDEARCSSVLATNWYVPVGDTQTDALGMLAIMNPLPRDAIVDVTFASEAEFGPFVAPALTGVVVPAWSTIVVNVGEHARRRDVVAASVRARTGRVAVDTFVSYDGSIGRRGFAAELASVNFGGRWLVPMAGIDDGTHLWVRVFNPSDEVAEVAASVVAEGLAGDRVAFAVASHDVTELRVSGPSELAPGLDTLLAPSGLPFGVSVVSQNDVPIVVWAEALVGTAANPLTDIALASDRVDAATESVSEVSGGESATVVAQSDESSSVGTSTGEPESDNFNAQDVVETRPPVLGAQAGLAFVPGIVQTSDRWLVVVAPESGAETFLTIMSDPLATAADSADPNVDPADEGDSDRRVAVRTLNGETVAVIEVPASGVVTHRLSSGTTRLLASETPFAVLLWQSRIGGVGLSVAHPLRW